MKSKIFYIAAFIILLVVAILIIFSGKAISDMVGHTRFIERITEIVMIFLLLRYWIVPEGISKLSEK